MTEHIAEKDATVWQSCYTCRDYARERREVIAVPLAEKARREGREVVAVVDDFMLAAHVRHVESGEPLRAGGPTRVTDPVAGRLLATYAMLGARVTSPGVGQP